MAKYNDPKVRVARSYANTKRIIRRPQHPFQLRTRPFQIQPFVIAPILPGETLKNALVQARVVTDPIKHPLVGWWNEYFLFYVKHRDINYHRSNDALEQMILNPNFDPASHVEASPAEKLYQQANSMPYTRWCLQVVTEWFFRDQGEDHDVATLDGLPLSQITGRSWMDSLTTEPNFRTDADVNLDRDADGNITVREMMEAQAHWEALRAAGLEAMDYEDFIRAYGVQIREPDASPNLYRPELVRYSREWTYPTNTVEPTTGVPSSAASWSIAFRADKDRFFKEPGFLFGVTVARPKVYQGQQQGSLVNEMKSVFTWLPPMLQNDYERAYVTFDHDEGPLAGIFGSSDPARDDDYKIDMRDLFIYGDQFVNFAADSAGSFMDAVTAEGSRRYPDATSIDNLFAGTAKSIRQDGIVTFAIAGRQQDRTPAGIPL